MSDKTNIRNIQSYLKLIVWIVVIGYLCFSSGDSLNNLKINSIIPLWLQPHMDKVVHFTMFFILAFLIKSLHWQTAISNRLFYTYLGLAVVYAASTEIIQSYCIATRSGDILDFGADLIGMALSVLVFPYWPRFVKWFFG